MTAPTKARRNSIVVDPLVRGAYIFSTYMLTEQQSTCSSSGSIELLKLTKQCVVAFMSSLLCRC